MKRSFSDTLDNDAYAELVSMCRRVRRGDRLTGDEMERIITAGESVGISLGNLDPRKYCETILEQVDTAWRSQPVAPRAHTVQDVLLPCDVLRIIANNLDPRDYARLAQVTKAFNNCLKTGVFNPSYNPSDKQLQDLLREKKYAHLLHRFRDVNDGLVYAAKQGDLDLVNLFIAQGANKWDWALEGAAEGGHRDLVDFFITKGANFWNWGLNGAALGGHRDLVDFFITKGADGWNRALYYAAQGGHRDLVDFFITKGANQWDGLNGAARGGHRAIVDFFIAKGANRYDDWALAEAAWGGHRDLVDLFIARGADDWNWALEYAAGGGHRDLVDFFIRKGARNWKRGRNGAERGGHVDLIDFFMRKLQNNR